MEASHIRSLQIWGSKKSSISQLIVFFYYYNTDVYATTPLGGGVTFTLKSEYWYFAFRDK